MFECGTCWKPFPAGSKARDHHCNVTGHCPPSYECDTCDAYFGCETSRRQHMDAKGHWHDDEFEVDNPDDDAHQCAVCPYIYNDYDDCKDHEVVDHNYCSDCQRSFTSLNNIKMHLNSQIHRGREVECPFCHNLYATATGMVHHLEASSCPVARKMSRDEIYRVVRNKDPHGVIANKLTGWSSEPVYEVSSKSWDGSCYRCYFCNAGFRALHSLQAHVNSSVHKQALYHCPNGQCGAEFKTLGAVVNHLESESCGAMRFESVQRRVNDMISSNRRIEWNI